jgi:hypothetical protein
VQRSRLKVTLVTAVLTGCAVFVEHGQREPPKLL